jgi:histidine ammonia-lyase
MKPGEGTLAAYGLIRGNIPHLDTDRVLSSDIEAMVKIIKSGELLAVVEKVVGKLD